MIKYDFISILQYYILYILNYLKRILPRNESSKNKFIEQYHKNFYLELTDKEFKKLNKFQKCINCSICELYCPIFKNIEREGVTNLSTFILSNSKDFKLFRFSYEELLVIKSCENCTLSCYNICPNGYPIFELIEFVNYLNKKYIKNIIEKG